jgi:hypothetical protein
VSVALPDDVESLSWLAKQTHIGLSTAYKLAAAGKLDDLGVFRVGTQYRVSVPAFNQAVHGAAT